MKKILFYVTIVFFTIACSLNSFGQANQAPNPQVNDYYDYLRLKYQDVLDNPIYKPDSTNLAFKLFLREANYWGPRLAPSGDVNTAIEGQRKYINDFWSKNNNCQENITWDEIGLKSMPINAGGVSSVGQINRIEFHPNYDGVTNRIIYGASHFGGVFKSEDGGDNWFNLNTDGLPLTGIADIEIVPNSPDTIIIAGGYGDGNGGLYVSGIPVMDTPYSFSGLFKSTDGGSTWNDFSGNIFSKLPEGGLIRRMEINPDNPSEMYLATTKGIIVCYDINSSNPQWQFYESGISPLHIDNHFIKFKPNNSNVKYCSGLDVYKTINNQWHRLSGPNFNVDFSADHRPLLNLGITDTLDITSISIDVSDAAPEDLYAMVIAFRKYTTFVDSDNDGVLEAKLNSKLMAYVLRFHGNIQNWELIAQNANMYEPRWKPILVSDINEYAIYMGNAKIFGSNNYTTMPIANLSPYSNIHVHADHHDLVFEPGTNQTKLFSANHGGVSVKDLSDTLTGGWLRKSNGIHAGLLYSLDVAKSRTNKMVGALQDAAMIYKNEGMNNWRQFASGDGWSGQFLSEKGEYAYTNNQNGSSFQRYRFFPNNNISNPGTMTYLPTPPPNISQPGNRRWTPESFKVERHPKTGQVILGLQEIWSITNPTVSPSNDSAYVQQSNLAYIPGYQWFSRVSINDIDFSKDGDTVYLVTYGRHFYDDISADSDSENSGIFVSFEGTQQGDLSTQKFQSVIENLEPSEYQDQSGKVFRPVITALTIDPKNASKVWISVSGYEPGRNVYFSNDYGQTWVNADPNGTLYDIPVNDIAYHEGSDDRIFIATDAGVFFKDEGTNDWCKYGNIPNVRVNEIQLNPCDNTITAGTFGRGVWQAALPTINNFDVFREISQSTTLTGEILETTSVKIKSGAIVRIEGEMEMPAFGKVVVEPGAQLIIDGGTITNRCGEMWQGIELWGNTNLPQTSQNQGRLVMINGATVEHALNGVTTWHPNKWNETGGFVICENSSFKNCRRAIEFMAYQNIQPSGFEANNRSEIKNCNFIWDDEYRFPDQTVKHQITMYATNGVKILNSSFDDQRTTINNTIAGEGMYTLDAGYYSTGNTFKKLRRGIKSGNGATARTIKVDNCNFEDNSISAEFTAIDGVVFTRNNLTIGDGIQDGIAYIGLWMVDCKGERVEENKISAPSNTTTTVGIAIQDGGPNDQLIYKNTLIGCYVGEYALGKNRSSNTIGPKLGVEFNCSENTNNRFDIDIDKLPFEQYTAGHGARGNQGDVGRSASNCFTQNGQDQEDVFLGPNLDGANDQNYNYFWQTTPSCKVPVEVSTNVNFAGLFQNDINCPSLINSFPVGIGIAMTPQK